MRSLQWMLPCQGKIGLICLLASLPEPFSVLITALEASPDVPRMEVVTERLLHEEWKFKVKKKIRKRR